MNLLRSEYSNPNDVLVHVSDPHFAEEGLLYGELDPTTAGRTGEGGGACSFKLIRIHRRTFVLAVVPLREDPRMRSCVTAEETRQRLHAALITSPPAVQNAGGTSTGRR